MGSLNVGHYTACCQNEESMDWILYNDENLSSVSRNQVVSKDAYILFYNLKSF